MDSQTHSTKRTRRTMANRLIQAYHQAPWRAQLQWIGVFLLGLVIVAFVAAIYLNVSAQAATTGREIQALQRDIDMLDRQNADLETQLAFLTSAMQMQKRAGELGFQPVAAEQQTYMVIPGYVGRQPLELAPVPGPDMVATPLLRPTYTQSLWEYLFQAFINPALGLTQTTP